MKCIYCNSEENLTLSDIITYAITGAKLTKRFVCNEHNAFTNDEYEKKFVADLDYFRNRLGLCTRDGKAIQYIADIFVDGIVMHDVKISNRESLYEPKDVVRGFDDKRNKILMGPMKRIAKISKGKADAVDVSDLTVHTKISSDVFLGFYAVHSIAKIAYEWYCYINNITDFREEYSGIVNYILKKDDDEYVDIIVDKNYLSAIDQISEIGTNTLFQYDDKDGYRYVVFDLWKIIAYRVRVCKSTEVISDKDNKMVIKPYFYHIDGSKSETEFEIRMLKQSRDPIFYATQPRNINKEIWKVFGMRIEKAMSTMVLTIDTLKEKVDLIASKLKKYNEGQIGLDNLLGYEDNGIIAVIEIISILYLNKEKYDSTKSFNQNLATILSVEDDTVKRTSEEKAKFIANIIEMDKKQEFSDHIKNAIDTFYEIYENEQKLMG